MACTVRVEDWDTVPRLTQIGMPRTVMLDILSLTVGERARVTASDPITTPGTENWRWATRFCRDDLRLRERGWVSCRHDQVDGIRNDILGIKLVAINTEACTGVPSKIPRVGKECVRKGRSWW